MHRRKLVEEESRAEAAPLRGERRVVDDAALRELRRLFDGDEACLLGGVLGAAPRRVADMRAAFAQRDLAAVAWAADTLRGAAELVGARTLSARCTRLAESARQADWIASGALIEAIGAEYARVARRLEAELRRGCDAPGA